MSSRAGNSPRVCALPHLSETLGCLHPEIAEGLRHAPSRGFAEGFLSLADLPSGIRQWKRPLLRTSRVSKCALAEETSVGFYHEQIRAIKAVALLPIGCESMA